jgi:hypothetical protein
MGRTWRKNSEHNKKSYRDEQRSLKKKREKIQKRLKLPDESIPEPRWFPEQKKER